MRRWLTILFLSAVSCGAGTFGSKPCGFRPTNEPLILRWWDGQYGATNIAPIALADLASTSPPREALGAAGTQSPTLVANAVNGWQAVQFVLANSQYTTFGGLNIGPTSDVMVASFQTNQVSTKFVACVATTNRSVGFSTSLMTVFDGTTTFQVANAINATNACHLFEYFLNGASGVTFYFDRTALGTAAGSVASAFPINSHGNVIGNFTFGGSMSYCIVFGGQPPASRRNMLYNWGACRLGVTAARP